MMASASPKDTVIWSVVAMVAVSVAFGMLLMLGIQKTMQNDLTHILIVLLVILPLLVLSIVVNTRRILKAIP